MCFYENDFFRDCIKDNSFLPLARFLTDFNVTTNFPLADKIVTLMSCEIVHFSKLEFKVNASASGSESSALEF